MTEEKIKKLREEIGEIEKKIKDNTNKIKGENDKGEMEELSKKKDNLEKELIKQLVEYGTELYKKLRYDKAAKQYEEAICRDVNNEYDKIYEAYQNLGAYYTKCRKYDEAEKYIYEAKKICLKKEKGYLYIEKDRANLLSARGELDEAIKIYDELLKNFNENFIYNNRGRIYMEKWKNAQHYYDKAEANFKSSIAGKPYTAGHNSLGILYEAKADKLREGGDEEKAKVKYEEAKEKYKTALGNENDGVGKTSQYVHINLAAINVKIAELEEKYDQKKSELYKEAIEEFEKVYKKDERFLINSNNALIYIFFEQIEELNLDKEDEQAINIFKIIMEIFKIKNELRFNMEKGSHIYHYTKKETLKILINDNDKSKPKMRMYNADTMNDENEGKQLLKLLCENNNNKSEGKQLLKLLCENNNKNSNTYLCSFSKSCDLDNMWEKYGDEGNGGCIGFDESFFDVDDNYISRVDEKLDDRHKYCLYNVLYTDKTGDIKNKKIKDSIKKIEEFIKKINKDEFENLIQMCLDDVRFLFKCKKGEIDKGKDTNDKDYDYEAEQEVRCVIYEDKKYIEMDSEFNYKKMEVFLKNQDKSMEDELRKICEDIEYRTRT